MTQRVRLFFFLLFFSILLQAQEKVLLRSYLESIETRFSVDFSFRDLDVANQLIFPKEEEDLSLTLQFIAKNSLFDYTVVDEKTIALSEKEGLLELCGELEFSGMPSEVVIYTPYEKILLTGTNVFSAKMQSPEETISIHYKNEPSTLYKASDFGDIPCKKITLDPPIELLPPVTLFNYFAKGISKNLDGSLSINFKDFDILPGLIEPDVLLTVQALPGIQSVNETVSYLNIRGGTNDQNLILWDGIKMYQNGHFFGLISAFNPQLTEEVTLIKNGTSAALGDGVSGTIIMESTKQINPKLKGGAGFNLISSDAFVDVPLGNIGSVQVSGRKSMNDLITTPTYNSYFDKAFQNTEVTNMDEAFSTSNDNFTFFDTSIRALFQPTTKDRFRTNFLYLGNRLKFFENATVNSVFKSLRSDLFQDNISGGFHYQRLWNDQFTSEAQFYGTYYVLQSRDYDLFNNQRLIQQNKVIESGISLKNHVRFSQKLVGLFGYQFNETGVVNYEQINNPLFERRDTQALITQSVFSEIHYRSLQNTLLTVGLRLNHVSKFNEMLLEPRFTFSHRFLKHFNFELLGELKSQSTSQVIDFQNDFLGVENRRWILSKPDEIPLLKSQQLSGGITFDRKGWLLSAEPYLKKVTGITTQSQGFQNQFEREKTHGSYTVKGIDVLLNKRFRKINTWLSYSYAKNQYTFEALVPQEFPNNIDIRHTFTYGITYSFNNFNISGGFNWHTGKPNTLLINGEEVVEGSLNFSSPNRSNINDYVRVDLSGNYEFSIGKTSKIFIGASVWNLLDNKNVINQYYQLRSNSKVESVEEFALRFTPNFLIRYLF
ncbi:MAG: TonB-dependent receptor plug domain-containing protein [Flavobacteriaceae bacterium]